MITLLDVQNVGSSSWILVFTTIAGSGVLSTILTFYFNRKSKHHDFRNDYRRYILDKRKAAYDKFERVIIQYSGMGIVETASGTFGIPKIFLTDVVNAYPIKTMVSSIAELNNTWLWYSFETRGVLNEVSEYLIGVQQGFPFNFQTGEVSASIVARHEEFRQRLTKQYFNDLRRLDDVDGFKKNVMTFR
jgi:hypothetical protein